MRYVISIISGVLLVIIIVLLFLFNFLDKDFNNKQPAVNLKGSDKTCLTCHPNMPFNKKYLHKPFAKMQCTSCHAKHDIGLDRFFYKEKEENQQEICFTCHFDKQKKLDKAHKHYPYQKGRCTDCHNPHGSNNKNLLNAPENKLCLTCHAVMQLTGLAEQHPPFKKGNCLDCHTAHGSTVKPLLKLKETQLCYSCHFDYKKEQHAPIQHKPYKQGKCTSCHEPHAARYDNLLPMSPNRFCFLCHTELEAKTKTGYQHPPFKEGKCLNCHKAHASKWKSLQKMEPSKLCFSCHPEFKKVFSAPSKHPVGTKLQCTSCHNPHQGPAPQMLFAKGNNLCYACHPSLKKVYPETKHNFINGPGGKGSCKNCHFVHASSNAPLLRAESVSLCLACHPKAVIRYSHPVGKAYKDPWNGGYMKCVSCHGPHGTHYKYQLRIKKDGLCLKCHKWNLWDDKSGRLYN